MKKKIILMRHAHALGAYESGVSRDFLRPLSKQGIADAGEAAALLKKLLGNADKIICSPRVRALQTAEIVAKAFGREAVAVESLGEGFLSGAYIKDIAAEYSADAANLIIVGHNPSISEAAAIMGCPRLLSPAGFAEVSL